MKMIKLMDETNDMEQRIDKCLSAHSGSALDTDMILHKGFDIPAAMLEKRNFSKRTYEVNKRYREVQDFMKKKPEKYEMRRDGKAMMFNLHKQKEVKS